jgi:hypothetical protein
MALLRLNFMLPMHSIINSLHCQTQLSILIQTHKIRTLPASGGKNQQSLLKRIIMAPKRAKELLTVPALLLFLDV